VFLQDPPLLLLDEATAALDSRLEAEVARALAQVMLGRTCITIAHRLATVRSAQRVVVLQGGRVVEEGTFEVLAADPQSEFSSIYRSNLLVPGAGTSKHKKNFKPGSDPVCR
jgi:ATP-binding cassette subfamily B protein